VGQISTELLHRPLTAPAEAVPDLRGGVPGLNEEHEGVVTQVGQEEGDSPRLIEAGEVPEIAVLAEGVLHIGVVAHQWCRRNHRRGTAQGLQETHTTLVELGLGDHHGVSASSEKMAYPIE
jgi:hypothetical protein